MVALDPEVPAFRAAEVGIGRELARFHLGFPVRAPELVFEQLEAVQPVFDVCAAGDNPGRVELADRLQVAGRRRINRVCGSRAREARLVVLSFLVVEQLIRPVDRGPEAVSRDIFERKPNRSSALVTSSLRRGWPFGLLVSNTVLPS